MENCIVQGLDLILKLQKCCELHLTEHDVPPKWGHMRSVGQSIARCTLAWWSGPRHMNNNEASYRDIAAEYMSRLNSDSIELNFVGTKSHIGHSVKVFWGFVG